MKSTSVKYCCDDDMQAYERYYRNQCGHSLPILYGARTQMSWTGKHFPGFVSLRFFFHHKYAPVIGRKAPQTGVRITNDMAEGQSFKGAAKSHLLGALEEGINNFVPQAEG